jgi:hypothetical protein
VTPLETPPETPLETPFVFPQHSSLPNFFASNEYENFLANLEFKHSFVDVDNLL